VRTTGSEVDACLSAGDVRERPQPGNVIAGTVFLVASLLFLTATVGVAGAAPEKRDHTTAVCPPIRQRNGAAASRIRARITVRCGADCERAVRSSRTRWLSLSTTGYAATVVMSHLGH
jgi:hypothetical protein